MRRLTVAVVSALALLVMALQPPTPSEAQTTFSNGARHPFYSAYTYSNGDWVRTEVVQEEVQRSITSQTVSDTPPDARPWLPRSHSNEFWRPEPRTREVDVYGWLPGYVKTGTTTVPNPATTHRHSSHGCQVEIYGECYLYWQGTHSHGSRTIDVYEWSDQATWGVVGTGTETYEVIVRDTLSCEWTNDCGGHALSGWNFGSHSTTWVLNYTEMVSRTVTYSCGSACTDVFVPVPPPVPSDLDPAVPQFDLSWRLDVVGPSPLLAQGSFADQQVQLAGAQLLCDGIPCDDPSLYSGTDFAVRPRPGGLEGSLSFETSPGLRVCDTPLQAGCDLYFPQRQLSGDLEGSGSVTVRAFSPPATGEQLSLLLAPSAAEVELWKWEPQLTFVPDPSGACTPTLDGCVQEGEWVASGPPVAQFDRVVEVDASLRMTTPDGRPVGEVGAGALLPLRVIGTVGS